MSIYSCHLGQEYPFSFLHHEYITDRTTHFADLPTEWIPPAKMITTAQNESQTHRHKKPVSETT